MTTEPKCKCWNTPYVTADVADYMVDHDHHPECPFVTRWAVVQEIDPGLAAEILAEYEDED